MGSLDLNRTARIFEFLRASTDVVASISTGVWAIFVFQFVYNLPYSIHLISPSFLSDSIYTPEYIIPLLSDGGNRRVELRFLLES